ncbi:lipid IV(A) 3-deoxy-D-manno-octulosonic acid transferase [Cysteiniphilum halobium]|uniref:lipid IV(A) 3-deoxy-D-manno-octulosonic acid transferase n=1 Tax=Cysteiniphilum halobium TaxID=2219059 RepID=UPI000E654141|nr:lipid IV(A) 3-deoxy-D-manno-octulosonic acid transferase [Cysteiniphilum halobium]
MIYTLIRFIYSVLFCLSLPFISINKLIRSCKNKGYRQRVRERFGFTPFKVSESIWVHSVSMGESIAIAPLIKKLAVSYPHEIFVITTMTPTGSAQVQKLYRDFDNIKHSYIPYDISHFLKRFIKRTHPKLCLIMETEIWPNLLAQCSKYKIPVVLINARLSQKSAMGYAKIGFIMRHMLKQISHISAQSEGDARRFIQLGMSENKISVDGNIKYDFPIAHDLLKSAQNLRQRFAKKYIWIAASTHQGEDEIILDAHRKLLQMLPDALLILVPRHPERFDQVAELIKANNFIYSRRSLDQYDSNSDVYLGDTMGEMMLLYAMSDIAFVGGSFVDNGGHNMLEPAALAKPIISGPSVFNFALVAEKLQTQQALSFVNDSTSLAKQLHLLFSNPEIAQAQGNAALTVFQQNKGALDKQFSIIKGFLC